MSTANPPETPSDPNPFRLWGTWAVILGGVALLLVLIQIFGPSFEPKPSAGQQIGEIAGEMKRAAWRSFLGLKQPEAEPVPASVLDYLALAGPVLGLGAILLSIVSGFRREGWRLPAYGTALGASAILFQLFWWVALLIAGVIILVAIIENLGDFFSFG